MTEEVKQEIEQVEQKPEPSAIELQAMEMGWRPKKEFDGNEDDFIDAKEFVRRKPLFDKIDTQNRKIKAVEKALEAFKLHYTKVEEHAVQKALQQLKNARKEALTDGDGDRFEAIDEQIKNTERQLQQIEATKNTPVIEETEPHPDFVAFKNRNRWYQTDPELTSFADKLGLGLANTGMDPSEVLKEIEKQARQRFPNKFRNPNKDSAPSTENGRPPSKDPRKEEYPLTEAERKIMNDLVRTNQMTKEEYIRDLKKIKGE